MDIELIKDSSDTPEFLKGMVVALKLLAFSDRDVIN